MTFWDIGLGITLGAVGSILVLLGFSALEEWYGRWRRRK